MRSPEEQEQFLEHGRFGEGAQAITCAKIHLLVWIGLTFLLVGAALLGWAVVFKVGRDDGGPLFVMGFIVMGFIAASVVGVALCIWGLVHMRSR